VAPRAVSRSGVGRGRSGGGAGRGNRSRGRGEGTGRRGGRGADESKGSALDHLERLSLTDRASWRAWLEKHHQRDTGVWLVSFKKATGKPRVDYDDAVEEALCFGWIDSLVRTLDGERAMQLFTPRRPRSPWSPSNRSRVEKLVETGLMRAAGLTRIEEAKRDGSWNAYAVAESLELPSDLRAAFDVGAPRARSNWDGFRPSSRRAILRWVHSAKRPETRARRIAQVVSEAAHCRRANFPEDRR
jgi:uncharacterized protein YdeI (YjbR/CyaY-like superfamily)